MTRAPLRSSLCKKVFITTAAAGLPRSAYEQTRGASRPSTLERNALLLLLTSLAAPCCPSSLLHQQDKSERGRLQKKPPSLLAPRHHYSTSPASIHSQTSSSCPCGAPCSGQRARRRPAAATSASGTLTRPRTRAGSCFACVMCICGSCVCYSGQQERGGTGTRERKQGGGGQRAQRGRVSEGSAAQGQRRRERPQAADDRQGAPPQKTKGHNYISSLTAPKRSVATRSRTVVRSRTVASSAAPAGTITKSNFWFHLCVCLNLFEFEFEFLEL